MTGGLSNQNLTNIRSTSYLMKNLFLTCLTVWLCSCENDIETINIITSRNKFPSESGKNMEVIYSDSAKVKLKLTSPQMDRYSGPSPYIELPKGVKVEFYDDSMKVKSKLTANYAIRYENERKMEAKRDVVVVNEKGEKLNTEHLIWDELKQRIYTSEFVKITTDEEVIYGEGLESNQDFTQYKIQNIKGTISINDHE